MALGVDLDGFGLDYQRMSRRETDGVDYATTHSQDQGHDCQGKAGVRSVLSGPPGGAGDKYWGQKRGTGGGGGGTAAASGASASASTSASVVSAEDQDDKEKKDEAAAAAAARNEYLGLRGHEWWGYADETLGWTLCHIAAAKNKVKRQITCV